MTDSTVVSPEKDRWGDFLEAWGRLSWRHPVIVVLICLTVAVCAGLTALTIHVETDIMNMLPEDSPLVRTMLDTMKRVKSFDSLYLVVTDPNGEDDERQDRMLELAETLAGKLEGERLIERVTYGQDSQQLMGALDFLLPRLTRYIRAERLDNLREKLTPESIHDAIRRDRLLLVTQQSPELRSLIVRDPLRLSDEVLRIMKPLISLQDFSGIDAESGGFFSRDGQALLMIIEPTFAAQDVDKSRVLVATIRKACDEILTTWEGKPPVVSMAGGPAIAVSDEALIKRDMQMTILTSVIGVLLFFQCAFRSWSSPLVVIAPLVLGIIDTIGFAAISLGRLNLLSSIFAVILVGLGIDFSIHLLHRFKLELQAGNGSETSIAIAYRETGRSIVAGAVTTSAAFLSITFTEFAGLKELGLVAGAGILLTLFNVLSLFPVLMHIAGPRIASAQGMKPTRSLWPTFEHHLAKSRWPIVITAGGFSFGLLVFFIVSGGITFESDLALMRPKDSPIWTTQQEVAERFLWQGDPLLAVIKGKNQNDVLQQIRLLDAELQRSPLKELVQARLSLADFVPSAERLEHNLTNLADLNPDEIRSSLEQALTKEGFRIEQFVPALDGLTAMLSEPPPITLEAVREAFGDDLMSTMAQRDGDEFSAITTIYVQPGDDREAAILSLCERLEQRFPDISVTGMQRIIPEFKRIVREDFFRATIGACLTVLLIIIIAFRNPIMVLLSLTPLVLGVLWTLGLMKFLGMHLNFMNMIVTPMLIGIGIDDGIHLVQHYLSRRRSVLSVPEGDHMALVDQFHLLSIPGKGIVLTSLTTMIGFGSLAAAHYPGLRWIGLLTMFGVGFCLLFSLIVLPALFYIMIIRRARR